MDSTTSLANLSQCSVTCMVKVFPDVQMEAPDIFPHFFWSNPDLYGLWYLAEQMFKSPSGTWLLKIPHLCTYSLHITETTTIESHSPLLPLHWHSRNHLLYMSKLGSELIWSSLLSNTLWHAPKQQQMCQTLPCSPVGHALPEWEATMVLLTDLGHCLKS